MQPHSAQIVRIASLRASSVGPARLAELVAIARREGIQLSEPQAREALAGSAARFLDDDWFWYPGGGRDRLSTLSRRILAVTTPLDLATIHAGISRARPRRRAALVPPLDVLGAFYEAHPDFGLDAHFRVRPASRLDYQAELGRTDRLLVDVLRSSWTGVLDRPAFRDACLASGMTRRTFDSSTAYSPILDHPAPDAWCLRGTRFSPIILSALRHAKGGRQRDR